MTSSTPQTEAASLPGVARASPEALAAPIRLVRDQPRPSARLRVAALLAALAAHAALLYAFTREPPDAMAGGRGLLPDAVNVTIVNSAVFESRQDVNAPPAPATSDAVDANEGTVDSKPAAQQPEQKQEKAEEKKAPEEPVPAEAIVKAPAEAPDPPQEQEKKRKDAGPPAAPEGGAAVRGDAPTSTKQSAPAAASPGAVREYSRYVFQALAKTKPKGLRQYGSVKVKLGLRVSVSGDIALVQILKSSGNKRLDDAALAAVQRAKLPAPPRGLSDDERWFEFNYRFD